MRRLPIFLLPALLLIHPPLVSDGNADLPSGTVLRDLSGKKVDLSGLHREGPLVIDFWALWCLPCLKQLPELQRIWDQYSDRGLSFVAVNEDSPSDQAKVRPYVKKQRYRFPVLLDEDKDLWYQFKVLTLPTTVLLNRDGEIVYSHTGYKPGDEAELIEQIELLLTLPANTEQD